MTSLPTETSELIRRARQGDQAALGELLERYRPWLRILAQRELDRRLQARLDASDLIQQTCLSACRNIEQFQGTDEGEFLAWLRVVLERNIRNAFRDHVTAQKRAVHRERPLDEFVDELSNDPTGEARPSQRALRGESAVRLAQALEKLSQDQREAVRLRFLEGCSLEQIAERLGRSPQAAIGLVKRGLQNLRNILRNEDDR